MINSEFPDSSDETSEPASEASSDSLHDEPSSGSSPSTFVAGGELTDAGKREVARWINEGMGLSEVQKTLAAEHGLTLTYMETRFLVDDLELALQDPEEPEAILDENPEAAVDPVAPEADLDPSSASESSGVSVEVDKVMRPGAVASGTVTFSDGVATQWQLDQFGRLAVTPKDDHKPSEEDLMAFQQQLQVELRKAGF